MEMSNPNVKSCFIQNTFSSTNRKNPPKLVPYRNDICIVDDCEAENSSPPHLLPEVIVTRTKLNKVTTSPHQNDECDHIKVSLEIDAIKTKIKSHISPYIKTESVLDVMQTEGSEENTAPSQMLSVSANTLSDTVLFKNSTNMKDELYLGSNGVNSKQKLPQLSEKLQKLPEVNSSVKNDVKQHLITHDISKAIKEQIVSLWDQSLYSNEHEPPEIIEIYNKKCTKKIENDSKLATDIKRMGSVNDWKSHHDASVLTSISKEKGKNISEENVFSYPQCRLPKMLDLNNAEQVSSSSKTNGSVTTNLNTNEQGISNIQNRHCESAVNFEVSNEQMAKNICNDLVNKVVKKCDYNKSNKWQPYCPSGNIWVAAHEDYKKICQKVAVFKKQHIKHCSMQGVLKLKQKPSRDVTPKLESDAIPECESDTESDIHCLYMGLSEFKLDISDEASQNSNFSVKQSNVVEKDNKNLIAVDIIKRNVNNVECKAEKVGKCKTKSSDTAFEPPNNSNKDHLKAADRFGRNLLLECNASWPSSMEPSFSGGRSYVSSAPDYWSDEDEDDEDDDNDKAEEYLSPKQSISTGKEERDTIDGVEFLAFETERDMVEFTKIAQDIQCNSCCDQGTNSDDGLDMMDDSFNSCGDHEAGNIQAIVPTKTKDITKIKGWRNKHFAINNNPSHCISSNNSNGPYEDDDGFESLDVKIQDEVIIEDEPDSFVETKENRHSEDQQLTSTQDPLKTDLPCDDEAIKSETKDDVLQAELNTDDKMKKAAFVSDEAEKFFSEFVPPDITFDVPQFKPEEVTVCLPTSSLMRLSPRLQRLPPRKPVTFWRKGLKCKVLAEKKMLMGLRSNANSSKRKLGRPKKKKRPRGRPRIHPSPLVDQSAKSLKDQLVSGKKLVSASSYDLNPDYKFTWVARKPIRITGSKRQKLKKPEDQQQKFKSSHIRENDIIVTKMRNSEAYAEKVQINGTTDTKTSPSPKTMQDIKMIMKLQENEEITVEVIQPPEEFSVIGNIKPTSRLQTLSESKSRALADKSLYSISTVKLSKNSNISEENKSINSMKMTQQLESSRSSNPVKETKSSGNKNTMQGISATRNMQSLKENSVEKKPGTNKQIKFSKISHATEQQNKEIRVAANKSVLFKQNVEELEGSKSQMIDGATQNTKKKEKNERDMCKKNSSALETCIPLPKGKRTRMVISPCIGIPLHPVAIKTLMRERSKNTAIDETWAKFAVSVVTSSNSLLAVARMKSRIQECKNSSFASQEEKHSRKMKTRGIKAVNYREKTRIICLSETLKKDTKIPVSGVVTRNRSAALSENFRSVSLTNTVEETNEPSCSNISALNEPCCEFLDVNCAKPEETKKGSAPACNKRLATSTRAHSRTSEKERHTVPKPRKGKEDACSSAIGSQKKSPIKTYTNRSIRSKCVTSEASSKEELNAICSGVSNEKDSTMPQVAQVSAETSKRLAVLIEMCSKTAFCDTNDSEKSKSSTSDKSNTLIETCTSLSCDESILEHKTKNRDGKNMPPSPSSILSSPVQSSLTTDSETYQADSTIKESSALFEIRSKEKKEVPLCSVVNGREATDKIFDISVKDHGSVSETHREKQVSLLSTEKDNTSLNEFCLKVSSSKIDSITSDINNKEHLCSNEIYSDANNIGNSKIPKRNSMESKSLCTTARKRPVEVNSLFNEEDSGPPKKHKMEENKPLSSVKVVIRKLPTNSKPLAERRERYFKTENSKRVNSTSSLKDKDARNFSANIRNEMALRAVNVEEQEQIGTKTLPGCKKSRNSTSFLENSGSSISEDLKAEVHNMLREMINCVVCHEIQDLVIKDDPDGCSDSQLITSHSPKKYKKKTKLNRELTRLSANLIVMNEYEVEKDSAGTERQTAMNCKNDFCQLGCICDSLLGNHMSTLPDHCGKSSCMFECSCLNRITSQNDKASQEIFGDRNHSRLYRTAVHLLDQGNRHLAKVEKEFSRTVIHSGKETVVVGGGSISDGGRRRREIKLPERYRDYNVAIGKEFALAEFKMISSEPAFDAGLSDTYRTLPNYIEVQVNQTAPIPARKKPKPLKGRLSLDQKMALLSERYGIKECSVQLMRLVGMDNIVPWCMFHVRYNCFCRGLSNRLCKKLPHLPLKRPLMNMSEKDVNESTHKSATEVPKVQKKSRNKAVKSTTLKSMHTHDVDLYSARTKGATMNYLLRNRSHYFKQKMDFKQQKQNTSDRKTMASIVETHQPDALTSNPENVLTGSLNSENFPPIVEQIEFTTENVTQDEDIGFGKIVSITTLKPEEFEKCESLEEINETDAGDIIENEEPRVAYNPEVTANGAYTEGLFEKMGISTSLEIAGCSNSSIAAKAPNEYVTASVCSTSGSGKRKCYSRIKKLILMKKNEIIRILVEGAFQLNLSQHEKGAIQVVKWPILCRKFVNHEVSIWVRKQGYTSKILITERELKPDIYSTNIRKYFASKNAKLPSLIQTMMEQLVVDENEEEKNADTYGLFYCDGELWELVGCMRKITDTSENSEMNRPEAINKEWQKENLNKSVMNASHEGLQGNLNVIIGIKEEYDHEEQSSEGILVIDRTVPDFRNCVQRDDSSKGFSAMSDGDCFYSPHLYNSDDVSHRQPYLVQTQNIEADNNESNIALSGTGEHLTLPMLLKTEDFGYETKNIEEDNAYSTTEFIAYGKDFESEMKQTLKNREYEFLLPNSFFPCRWYVFVIRTPFDYLCFYKHHRNVSFKQITEVINIANKNNKTVRFPLDSKETLLESHYPKFGIYAIANIVSYFFIGPYGYNEEIDFYALKNYKGMMIDTHMTYAEWNKRSDREGIKINHGMWYYAVKSEEDDSDTDSEKTVEPDFEKTKINQTSTARFLEPHCSTDVETVNMQTEAINNEIDNSSSKSRRKQSLKMRSLDSNLTPSKEIELGHEYVTVANEEKETSRGFSNDGNEEEELDIMSPCDVSSMVREMKDHIQRDTTQHKLQGAAAMQIFPDTGSTVGDSEAEFRPLPPLPSSPSHQQPSSHLHQLNDSHRGPRKTAVPIKLVPSIPSLGFISASMYHNKSIEFMNPFAEYREVKVFKNLSNLTRWLTSEIKQKMKYFPEDLKLLWRVKQASQNIKNCEAFNPEILNGTYILTEKGVIRIRNSGMEPKPAKGSKKARLHRSFQYLKRTLKAGNSAQKLSKLDVIQKALEEIKMLVKQSKSLPGVVRYLKQERLNTFKHFCAQLKDFTNEEKRSAMICLKNVMRKQSIPIVHLDDDQDNTESSSCKSRDGVKQSASVTEDYQGSYESSIEDYLSSDEADSDLGLQEDCSLSACSNVEIAHKVKESNKENAVLISSDGDEDEMPLSNLLQNPETEFSKVSSLTKSSKDEHMSISLSHRSNVHGENLGGISIEEEIAKNCEKKSQQGDRVAQTNIDDRDSVSISIVTDDLPQGNTEVTQNNNRDVVTMTYVTQQIEQERSVEGLESENKNLKSYEQKSAFITTPGINETKLISTPLLYGTPENDGSSKKVHITNGSNQENATLTNLQFDKQKDKYIPESAIPTANNTMTNEATVGPNQQFFINGIPVSTSTGGFCYKMPPLLSQRNSLSLTVGSKQPDQQASSLKRVFVTENSVASNAEKNKLTSSEPPQKVRIINAPEEWKGKLITTTGLENNQNINRTKLTYVNASGNIQTSQALSQHLGSKTASVPKLPALVIPNNNVIGKTGYHLVTREGTNFKIVQKHKKVDIEFPKSTQSSPVPKVSSQMTISRPIRFVPATALCSVTDSGQQNAGEGPKQVIKLKSVGGIERPNLSSQLKSLVINGQKVFVQNAERTYPLLVASPSPGKTCTLLNSETALSTGPESKSECFTDSDGPSNAPRCSSQTTSSCLTTAPKAVFVSSSNYSNVLKAEANRTTNRCTFSPVGSLHNGSKAFWIKGPLNRPVMFKVVNTKTSTAVPSPTSAVQQLDATLPVQSSGELSSVQSSGAPSTFQGCSNVFEAVSLKCAESSSSGVSEDTDVVASFSGMGPGNSESDALSNNTSVSQCIAEDKVPEVVSDRYSKIQTNQVLEKQVNTKTHVYKCTTEEISSKSAVNKSKLSKLNSTEAKKNMIIKDGVTTRSSKEVILRTAGMTTRSSKTKKVKP